MKTALADKSAGLGAALAEYSGAESAANFGDVRAEFDALLHGCGVFDLGWRGKLIATGVDRTRWFNGMVTNNIKDLNLNYGNYNFVLSAQGRVQGDLFIYNRGDYLLLDTDRSQVEHLLKLLNHFIIMDDVELKDASEELSSIGLRGPKAAEVLQKAGIATTAGLMEVKDATWSGIGVSVVRKTDSPTPAYEIWLAPSHVASLWDALAASGAKPVGTESLEKFRVLAGVPKYGKDIREKDLPQETEQKQALNFTKGCYIGQEIVERIRSRGAVHRMFTGFELEADAAPGSELILPADGKKAGELTSVVKVPVSSGERILALGYFRREAGGPGLKLRLGEQNVTVTQLPFLTD